MAFAVFLSTFFPHTKFKTIELHRFCQVSLFDFNFCTPVYFKSIHLTQNLKILRFSISLIH